MKSLEKNFFERYEGQGLSYWEAFKKERKDRFTNMIKHSKSLIISTLIYTSVLGAICFGFNELGKSKIGEQYNNIVKELYLNKK